MTTELISNMPEKLSIYLDFIDIFIRTVEKTKRNRNIGDLGTKLLKTGLGLMVVAPDIVVEKYTLWRALAMEGGNFEKIVSAFGNVVLEMRKDLIGETDRNVEDVLDIFLKG